MTKIKKITRNEFFWLALMLFAIFTFKIVFSEAHDFLWKHNYTLFTDHNVGGLPFHSLWVILIGLLLYFIPYLRDIPLNIDPRRFTGKNLVIIISLAVITVSPNIIYTISRENHSFRILHFAFLSGAIIGPIVEEWLFRGLLWKPIVSIRNT